jgi:hypothetical protein
MNNHIKYLLSQLLWTPALGGLIIHPDVKELIPDIRAYFGRSFIKDERGSAIRLANDSRLKLSTGKTHDYKSCTYHIVYIHEELALERAVELYQSIPRDGIVLQRIS